MIIEQKIEQWLIKIGIFPHLNGYQNLVLAIQKTCENPKIIYCMIKELYPEVAKELGTTPTKVERHIRYCIERAYYGNSECFKDFKRKPKNSMFIAWAAQKIKLGE